MNLREKNVTAFFELFIGNTTGCREEKYSVNRSGGRGGCGGGGANRGVDYMPRQQEQR